MTADSTDHALGPRPDEAHPFAGDPVFDLHLGGKLETVSTVALTGYFFFFFSDERDHTFSFFHFYYFSLFNYDDISAE